LLVDFWARLVWTRAERWRPVLDTVAQKNENASVL
jgi:hypothetical protein